MEFVSQIKCKLIQCRFREIIHDSPNIVLYARGGERKMKQMHVGQILFDQKDLLRARHVS
jgi:hypothetical protein